MTTMADLIANTRRMAYGSMSEQINIIAAAASAGATSLTMELAVDGITAGTILSSKLNVWYVKSVDTGTKTVYVVPGYDNAPQGAVAIGDVVYVKARATGWVLFNLLNNEISSLSSPRNGLYAEDTFTLNVDSVYETYDIPVDAQDLLGIIGIRVLRPSSPDVYFDLSPSMWHWQSSKNLIRITRNLPASSTIEVRYKAPFVAATGWTDNVASVCRLYEGVQDIPPLGAAAALLRTTEGRRAQVQTQGDPRRADEVQVGSNLSAAAAFERDYRSRVDDEYARIIQRNPIFKGV